VIIIQDTREQNPLQFSHNTEVVCRKLDQGDYSVAGLENEITIERKSLSDLLGSITTGRERFARELERMAGYKFAALLVESDWRTIITGQWDCPSKVHPNSVLGSLISFQVKYGVVPIMAHNHAMAAVICERILTLYASKIERDRIADTREVTLKTM
jgi:DNA excision repair protein ERCC-4